jgi:hypothetical protein
MKFNKCSICGSSIKSQSDSLHAWVIEYLCGFKIFGSADSDDKSFGILNSCKSKKD